jgi:DNA-directed RNA polymerase specialized sigma24 family protein
LGRTRELRHRRARVAQVVEHVDDIEQAACHRALLLRRAQATLGGEPELAEDLVQDAFVELLQGGGDVAKHPSLLHALLRLVGYRAYLRVQHPPRHDQPLDAVAAAAWVADPAQLVETRSAVEAVWHGLTPRQRQVMGGRLAGFTLEEMATQLRQPFGTISSAISRAHERAREVRQAWLVFLVPAWRRFALRLRRLIQRCGDAAARLTEPVHGPLVSLAVGVAAVTLSSPLAQAGPPAAGQPAGLTAALVLAGAHASPVHSSSAEQDAGTHTSAPAPASPRATPPSTLLPRLPGTGATAETPEDTQIVDTAPSPHFADDHTLVALGVGQTCSCPVLLRSTDGGATWPAAAAAPLQAQHIVLPPNYPADPRIFVANLATGDVPDFVAAGFGQPFLPLPLPPGDLHLSAGFDGSDPRLFVAASSAVWSEDTATGAVAPVLTYPTTDVATLATPLGETDTAVLVVAPRLATTPAALLPTSSVTLFACGQTSPCTARAALDQPVPGALALSPDIAVDHTLLVFWQVGSVVLSSDEGRTFRPLPLPAETQAVDSAALARANTGSVVFWASVQRPTGHAVLASQLGGPNPWSPATTDAALSRPGILVPADADRLIFLAYGLPGLRCSADNGASWHPRCPSSP